MKFTKSLAVLVRYNSNGKVVHRGVPMDFVQFCYFHGLTKNEYY